MRLKSSQLRQGEVPPKTNLWQSPNFPMFLSIVSGMLSIASLAVSISANNLATEQNRLMKYGGEAKIQVVAEKPQPLAPAYTTEVEVCQRDTEYQLTVSANIVVVIKNNGGKVASLMSGVVSSNQPVNREFIISNPASGDAVSIPLDIEPGTARKVKIVEKRVYTTSYKDYVFYIFRVFAAENSFEKPTWSFSFSNEETLFVDEVSTLITKPPLTKSLYELKDIRFDPQYFTNVPPCSA